MEIGSQINEVINNICDKLGTTTETLFPELTKYFMAKYMAQTIVAILVMGLAIALLVVLYKFTKFDCSSENAPIMALGVVLLSMMLVIGFIMVLVGIYDYIIWSQAPVGATAAWIVEQLRGIK